MTYALSALGSYAVAISAVCGFTEDVGGFVEDQLTEMDEVIHRNLFRLSAPAVVGMADNTCEVVA